MQANKQQLVLLFCLVLIALGIQQTLIGQGQIVFRSDRDGNARLYTMNSDGTDLRMLEAGDIDDVQADTSASYAAAAPRWSADGRQITFYTYWGLAKDQTDGQDIVIINADGTNRKRLTKEGFNTDPSWSPDGKRIVFRALKDRNWGLYIIDIQTGKITLLIDTPYMDRSPDWSPDGKRIVFSSGYGSDRETEEDIFIIDADGTNLTQLTEGPGEESLARWSPDGQTIIYNEGTENTAHLFTMRPDGSEKKQLTFKGINYAASFASDGQQIVYNAYADDNAELFSLHLETGETKRLTNHPQRDNGSDWFVPKAGSKIVFKSRISGNDEICTMNIDGSDLTNLTQHEAEDRRPWWSPDGKKIFFETNRNGHWDIYEMKADGSQARPVYISENQEKYPGVSYDGRQVAFLYNQTGKMGLYKIQTDGTGLQELSNFADFGEGVYDNYPSWSPDGKLLCFGSNRDTKIPPTREGDKGLEIYTMRADGSQVQRLTFNKEEDSLPVFSPDGQRLLFNSSRTGLYHLYTMLPDGREVTPLTWGAHNNWGARYSNDGQYIVFVSSRSGGSDIYIMDANGKKVRRLSFNGVSSSPCLYLPSK